MKYLAKLEKCKLEEIAIDGHPNSTDMLHAKDKVYYFMKCKYKDVAFLQSADGMWKSDLWAVIKQGTLNELKQLNQQLKVGGSKND